MTRLVLLACLVAGTAAVQAQAWRFSGGPTAGFSMAQVHGDGQSGFNKLGVSAGLSLDVTTGSGRTWHSGLLWTTKGSRKVPNPKAGDYDTWRYKFTYIDVPLMRAWRMPSGVWLAGGVQASYLIRGEEDFNNTGYTPLTYLDLKPVDIGGIGAVGFDGTRSRFEVRLSQSLLPIAPRPPSPIPRYDNFLMNLCVQVLGGWHFSASR